MIDSVFVPIFHKETSFPSIHAQFPKTLNREENPDQLDRRASRVFRNDTNRFQVREVVSKEGGFGQILRIWDKRLKRNLAGKIVKPDIINEYEKRALLSIEKEAQVTAGITHPNITTIYEFMNIKEGSEETSLILMEYLSPLEGWESLETWMLLCKGMNPRDILFHFRNVIDALIASRQKNIIHRDVKPSNILANPSDTRLTDFGLSNQVWELSDDAVDGSARYITPSRFRGIELETEAEEVYNLGIILFEALTGYDFYESGLINGIYFEQNDIKMEQKIDRAKISAAFKPLLKKALRFLPENRYPTLNEFYDSFKEILEKRTDLFELGRFSMEYIWRTREKAEPVTIGEAEYSQDTERLCPVPALLTAP